MIDPWHLAATIEGLRLRMDPYLRIIDRGEILDRRAPRSLCTSGSSSRTSIRRARCSAPRRCSPLQPPSLPPLIAAAHGFREWIESGETRPADAVGDDPLLAQAPAFPAARPADRRRGAAGRATLEPDDGCRPSSAAHRAARRSMVSTCFMRWSAPGSRPARHRRPAQGSHDAAASMCWPRPRCCPRPRSPRVLGSR